MFLSWKLKYIDAMIGLPHNSVNVVPIAVQRPSLAGLATFSLSRRYFAVQLQRYRDVHFQAASINRPPLYIWLKLPRRTPVHSQIQDFVVEHVVRTECVLPASLQSTYKPSTSVGTLSENSMFPTTWWPLCGRNLIEIYHIVNFKVTPE